MRKLKWMIVAGFSKYPKRTSVSATKPQIFKWLKKLDFEIVHFLINVTGYMIEIPS